MTKWRVGIASIAYHMVELECETPEQAVEKALDTVRQDPENYLTAYNMNVTSVMVNDHRSKNFANYIPEIYPDEKKNGSDTNKGV